MPFKYREHGDVVARMVSAGVATELAQAFFDAVSVGSTPGDSPVLLAMRHDGELVTSEVRNAILAKLAKGETVAELEADIVGFRQAPGVMNRNFMRLADKKKVLRATATSGRGMPFLANHDHRRIESRMGTIAKSGAVFEGDEVLFVQTLKVVTPTGIEGFLRGTIDRFSVGWAATGPVNCSICETPVFEECWHLPGQEVKLGDDANSEVAVCEWVFTEADLIEVSAVNVPAVLGTGIREVRAALSRANNPPARPAKQETGMNHEQTCAMLGLPASTTEDELKKHLAKLAADSARVNELESQTAQLKADQAVREAQEQAIQVERRIQDLKTEGKLSANGGKVESALRAMAAADFSTFTAYCDQMPVIIPVGTQAVQPGQPSFGVSPNSAPTDGVNTPPGTVPGPSGQLMVDAAANPFLGGILRALNLTADDVAKYGPTRPMGASLLDRNAYEGKE
jgi:phage head maturation protease